MMTMMTMMAMMTMMIKVKGATDIGKCNLFPMVTSNIRVVRARTLHRETMLHITFLKVNFVIIILKRDHTISKMIGLLFTRNAHPGAHPQVDHWSDQTEVA